MAITEAQRKARRSCIGSSDVPSIMLGQGIEVYMSKVYDQNQTESDAAQLGTDLEGGVLDWAERVLGPIARNQTMAAKGSPIVCNVDGIVKSTGEPVEAKTHGIISMRVDDNWGSSGTDEVPPRVYIQCQAHMMATGRDVCHVPALIAGKGMVMYRVKHNPELCKLIAERCTHLWNEHVANKVPPPVEVGPYTNNALRLINRDRKTIKCSNEKAVENWLRAKSRTKYYKKVQDEAESKVLVLFGDADAIVLNDGSCVTYFDTDTKRVDTKALRAARPDVAELFTKESSSRRLLDRKILPEGMELLDD